MKIPFNKPYFSGKEADMLIEAAHSGQISGNGVFTKKCHRFFEKRYGFEKVFLTTSCTDALEMSAILTGIQPGDEVICPSFAFVSTANAFVLRGAKIVFADSGNNHPNIDADKIEELITAKTKVIVVIHYAGCACDMDKIMSIANRYQILVIEDAAQSIDSFYGDRPLGSIGHFSAFSFHETKNIISGEGGMLVVNDEKYIKRAEIIWEKGTNRAAFFRGEVDKYRWVDIGSSFLTSELVAAFLFGQLQAIDDIQEKRMTIWKYYFDNLADLARQGFFKLPFFPDNSTNNAHMFYLICRSGNERNLLIDFLKRHGIQSVFHYLPLHFSPYFQDKHDGRLLPNALRFSDTLIRLPFYNTLTQEDQSAVVDAIDNFFKQV